ncbi:MAG: enoyl-CoA hydratase/isomerase family protein [Opitutales bacterium]
MDYTTFKLEKDGAVLKVSFDNPPVNIQDLKMLDELDALAETLENDRSIKVIIFQSNHPEIFVAHADVGFLKDMSSRAESRESVELLYLQKVLERISDLPQVSIAKIEGYCRGGGDEFALACDMRFASLQKAIFMQMEVGMGILPCGGGTSRMARQMTLGRALEYVLSARDFTAKQAEEYGLINKALDDKDLTEYVESLAKRIALFSPLSIEACKKMIKSSIDMPIKDALKEEAWWLYQMTSTTPALKRFQYAYDTDFQNKMENQRGFEAALVGLQDIK